MQQEIDVLNARALTASAAAVRSSKAGPIFTRETISAKSWLQTGSLTRRLRGVNTLLIEFCTSADSGLTKNGPYGCVAFRITDKEDFTKRSILKAIE